MARGRRVEENEIFVKVARTGGQVHEVCLNGERTVEDALEAAEVDYSENSRIRVNGVSAELEDELSDGDNVTVSGKIKGGC